MSENSLSLQKYVSNSGASNKPDIYKSMLENSQWIECRNYVGKVEYVLKLQTHLHLNGRAERYNRLLLEKIHAMMIDSGIDKKEWPLVVKVVVYLIDRLSIRSNESMTTYVLYFNKKPDLNNLRVFGCTLWIPSFNESKNKRFIVHVM